MSFKNIKIIIRNVLSSISTWFWSESHRVYSKQSLLKSIQEHLIRWINKSKMLRIMLKNLKSHDCLLSCLFPKNVYCIKLWTRFHFFQQSPSFYYLFIYFFKNFNKRKMIFVYIDQFIFTVCFFVILLWKFKMRSMIFCLWSWSAFDGDKIILV